MNSLLADALSTLPTGARVLDCGGWLIPLDLATHVADIMPYETRRGRLSLGPLPEERFTKATWLQCDFLQTAFRLPFPDGYFSFSTCSHTLEDLVDPFPLLIELQRVSRAGCLVTPSRLYEQTAGIRDRMTSRRGHPHHHWILDTVEGKPQFSHKGDSLRGSWWSTSVPLSLAEEIGRVSAQAIEWSFVWDGQFEWSTSRGSGAHAQAREFARHVGATRARLAKDGLRRQLRRLKYIRRVRNERLIASWWSDMVQLSEPYSRIPLK